MRIGHGLQRGEGLGGDNEQALCGIDIAHRLDKVRAVDIGDEAEGHGPLAVVLERFVGHDRPKVRSADADIDHIANALARMALPGAAAHPMSKICHPVQNSMDFGHDILAVLHDGRAPRRAQGDMKRRTVLRDVDLVAPEHGVNALPQP
jgi:hypothetical protein